jgi:cytochrome b561
MSFNPDRNIASVAIFWLFVGFCAAAFALGWSLDHAPIDPAARADLSDLHISLGLCAALLLLAQFFLGAALHIYRGDGGPRSGREIAGFWLRQLVFLAFLVTAGAAALAVAFRGEQMLFWGHPLPLWDLPERALSEPLQKAHAYAAHVFAAAVLAYATFAIFDLLFPARAGDGGALEPFVPTSTTGLIAEGLARSFRFFGGSAFWLELFLGVISGVLLGFGFAGRTISPGGTVFGDAIFWAAGALGILVPTTLFAFKYMKTAGPIRKDPARYLSRGHRWTFWFVIVGGLLSVLGLLDSFVGVGLSVALLIGKTMSQPPGIAITDPTKIIRALDIFVLLVNFNLLFAHFVGFGVAAWLRISSLQARHQYLLGPWAAKQPPVSATGP